MSRPATGGDPERALGDLDEDASEDEWAPEGGAADPTSQDAARERWWQEQRPPHWE